MNDFAYARFLAAHIPGARSGRRWRATTTSCSRTNRPGRSSCARSREFLAEDAPPDRERLETDVRARCPSARSRSWPSRRGSRQRRDRRRADPQRPHRGTPPAEHTTSSASPGRQPARQPSLASSSTHLRPQHQDGLALPTCNAPSGRARPEPHLGSSPDGAFLGANTLRRYHAGARRGGGKMQPEIIHATEELYRANPDGRTDGARRPGTPG